MSASPVERILVEMRELYGNLFDRQWGNRELKDMIPIWERKLKGFSNDELRRGYKALEKLKYPPTLPEFMQLCRPPIDPVKAYHEAVAGTQARRDGKRGEWSHPAIFWAAAAMAHDLLNMSYQQVKARFEKKLSDELEKTAWQEIPEVHTPLPAPKVNREKGKAEAEKMLKRVGASDVVKSADAGNGDWIARNMRRLAEGWKTTAAVRRMTLDAAKAKGIPLPEGFAA